MAEEKRKLQQIRLPPEVHRGFKLLSCGPDHWTLGEVYDESVRWFLATQANKSFHYYLASDKRGEYTSIWIDAGLLDQLKVIKVRDSVPISRVIYTAFVLYLDSKEVL